MNRLSESLRETPIVEKEGYHYFVHPISDGVPELRPELLREITVRIVRKADLTNIDKIVAPEAMGIHIATALSLATDIPLVVARKREYGLDGEVSLSKATGYEEADLYINDVREGDRVLVLDDVLSTGGTLSVLLPALEDIGAEVVDTVVVIKKVGNGNELDETDYEPKTLVNVAVDGGELVIVDESGDD
jgi:adenine phosphoribosyltransferase